MDSIFTIPSGAKSVKCVRWLPADAAVDEFYSGVMKNGSYGVVYEFTALGGARTITATQTAVEGEDANGILTVTGLDFAGQQISDTITPNHGETKYTTKAFKSIISIVGSEWVANGGADTITIGYGNKIGLPFIPAWDGDLSYSPDILLVTFDSAVVNTATLVTDADILSKNTITVAGFNGSKWLRVFYLG